MLYDNYFLIEKKISRIIEDLQDNSKVVGIISAFTGNNDKINTKQLEDFLSKNEISFGKLDGMYLEIPKNIQVDAHNIPSFETSFYIEGMIFENIKELAQIYNQYSFIYKDGNKFGLFDSNTGKQLLTLSVDSQENFKVLSRSDINPNKPSSPEYKTGDDKEKEYYGYTLSQKDNKGLVLKAV